MTDNIYQKINAAMDKLRYIQKENKKVNNQYNIYQKINAAMDKLRYIQKENKKVNNQYTFVSHDAVTAKCADVFRELGIVQVPTIIEHSKEWITSMKYNKYEKREEEVVSLFTTVTMNIEFVNTDNPEDRFSTIAMGYGIDNQDKGIGKAISYANKYALLKVLMLETGDDPEKEASNDVKSVMSGVGKEITQDKSAYEDWFRQIKEKMESAGSDQDLDDVWKKAEKHLKKLEAASPKLYRMLVGTKSELKANFITQGV